MSTGYETVFRAVGFDTMSAALPKDIQIEMLFGEIARLHRELAQAKGNTGTIMKMLRQAHPKMVVRDLGGGLTEMWIQTATRTIYGTLKDYP